MEHCTYCYEDVMTLDGHVCEDDAEMEQYLDDTRCPVCDGEGAYMGSLGPSPWFRCIHCGMEYTESGLRSQGPVDLTVAEEDA